MRAAIRLTVGIALAILPISPQLAQAFTYSTVYTFGSVTNDGVQPLAGLAQRGSSNTLWGTTCGGGTNAIGAIYSFDLTNPASTYSVRYSFGTSLPTDGSCPAADLNYQSSSGGKLSGTTQFGGLSGLGTVFKIKSSGVFPYSQLYPFAGGTDGSEPLGQVVHYGGSLWGTTGFDGTGCCTGTIFKVTGSTEFPLYTFPSNYGHPTVGLTEVNAYFYGAAQKINCGHIFRLQKTSPGYNPIYTLVGSTDGCHITSRLFRHGSALYGVTQDAGAFGCGTFFSFGLPLGPFTDRYDFQCNAIGDSQMPGGDIAYYNNKFYGTTQSGGGTGCGGIGCGTVFEIDPTSWTQTSSYALNGATDGATPYSGVNLIAGALYGTASAGGSGNGTIFKVQ